MSGPTEGPIRVTMPRDAMQVSLTLLACADDALPAIEECLALLRDREVIIDDAVEARVRAMLDTHADDPTNDREAVVAEGVAPRHGEAGRFDLEPVFAAPVDTPPQPDPDGHVDHYSRSTFHLVKAGQRIGRIIEPTAGEPGRTVQGKPVAAKSGRPCDLKLDATVERRGEAIVALVAGALQHQHGAVSVLQTLDIREDVDYATGNLRFPGDIAIGGCVRDCFVVQADGDITVRGVVEAATVTAGRDAHLLGGMAGREKGSLLVGRDLEARYLGMVSGVVGRDATVEREVVDCDLEVRGAFTGERCVIVGGRLAACAGAEIGEIGRESGVRTEVVIGRVPRADLLATRAADLLRALEEREADGEHDALPLDAGALAQIRGRLADAATRLRDRLGPRTEARLLVQRQIHRGAVLVAGDYELSITNTLRGPIRLTTDLGGMPRVVQVSSNSALELSSFARVRHLRSRAADEAA